MRKAIFTQFAAYNRWANSRLYGAALDLPDEDYRRPLGVFFGSLHGTLNHLLAADRIWLRRLTGEGEAPARLDTILHDDLRDLLHARQADDERFATLVAGYEEADFDRMLSYRTTAGVPHEQRLGDVLQHVFNHQTHHRGQAHACCSILTGQEPPSLDMLAFQRGAPAPVLA